MEDVITTSLIRKVMILGLLVAGTFWFSRGAIGRLMPGESSNIQQSPTIILTPQEDSPLQILSTWVATDTPQNFRLMVQVQNQGGQAIRAYAINSQTASAKHQNGSTEFLNLTQRSAFWQPTEIKTVEVADSQDEPIKSVRLTIDFVEFADGSTWGPDSANSRDFLAGQREGAKLARQRLRQLMQNKGVEALTLEVQKGDAEQTVDPDIARNHSPQWVEGFRYGAASTHRRLANAIASKDKERIKAELDRPFDTFEEKHKLKG
jgi:hypothetical protein